MSLPPSRTLDMSDGRLSAGLRQSPLEHYFSILSKDWLDYSTKRLKISRKDYRL